MNLYEIVYASEIWIFIVCMFIYLITCSVKKKKHSKNVKIVIILTFILAFVLTYIFEKPIMNVEEEYNIEAKLSDKLPVPETKYHLKDVTKKVTYIDNVDYNKIGEYEVEYSIKTLVGIYSKKVTVKVVDTTKPEIILDKGEDYKLSYKKEYKEPGYKAIDSYNGDLTDKVKVTKEKIDETNFNIKYEVEDLSGNKAEKIRKVKIIDDIAPVITLNDQEKMTIVINSKYEEKGATAKDEKDGDLTSKIKIEGSVDTSKEGTYEITYTVEDSSNNKASKKRKVTVAKSILSVQSQGGDGSGVIYLTFDDGPTTNITPRILDILKSKNVKATFFVINYDSSTEYLIKREHDEGHTVAIHGYSHDYKYIYTSEDIYMSNITKLQEKIKATTGYNSVITRFPGGSSNTVSKYNPGIMTRLCKLLLEKGYRYFDWNVDSEDAGSARNADDAYNNVIKDLSKSKQNVVLMHDFSSNYKILDALPRIIDYGIANGYTFSNITENTPMVTHPVNN